METTEIVADEPKTIAEADALLIELGITLDDACRAYIAACDAYTVVKKRRVEMEVQERAKCGIC